MQKTFLEIFDVVFEGEWYTRNILVNHEVYWRKNKNLESPNIKHFRQYLANHSIGKDYSGIVREMQALHIFGPSFDSRTGFINPIYNDEIMTKIHNEYCLDYKLEGLNQNKDYTVADLLWDIYRAEERKTATQMMLKSIELFFGKIFSSKFKTVFLPEDGPNRRQYLIINWKNDKEQNCYINFDSTLHTRDQSGLFVEFGCQKIKDSVNFVDKQAYSVLCGLDFSSEMIESAIHQKLILVQFLSLIRLFGKVNNHKDISPNKILSNFNLLFEDNQTPISTEDGFERILQTIQ
jgi:hypothetical protein